MSRQLLPLPVIPLQIFIALCAFAVPHIALAAEAETITLSSGEVQLEFKLSDTQNKRDAAE